MKTAISLPDGLFDMAESVAARLNLTRSELYRQALEEFIRNRHAWVIREKLDTGRPGAPTEPDTVDDQLLRRAADLTGVTDRAALLHVALEALIARESARRLADLGGTQPHLDPIPRRRPDKP